MLVVKIFLPFITFVMSMYFYDTIVLSSNETMSTAISAFPTEIRPRRDAESKMGYAEISWEALLLLLPSKPRNCAEIRDSALNRKNIYLVDRPLWLRRQPDEPVGTCPARFRLDTDADRVWPRSVICTECVCEGSRCARRGAHVCVTVHIVRTIITRTGGWRRQAIPAGCLCAAKRATINSPPSPHITI
ncbi:uncharacterized protein LOC120354738 [Nilaparvata lugens]|uniref:uncharacterized protein LOC120354738 n=1 Tax=Nilaparvata lugens TaxID=108931 RepID=UPI00193E34BD|nr:uncharacterized protein LOC120354738 [Nilaparvata lugens]